MLTGYISCIGGDGSGIIKAAKQPIESVLVASKPGGF